MSIKPVENLVKEGLVNVVMWFDREGDRDFKTKDFSYVPQIMLDELVRQPLDPQVAYAASVDKLPTEFMRFCDVYARVNYSKGLDYFDHLNLFHLYYQFFSHIILKHKVDAVVFFEPPHSGADYVLYLAARARGARTIVAFQSQVPNRFYCVTDLEDMGVFETTPFPPTPVTLSIPREFRKDLFYMKKAKHKRGWMLSRLLRDVLLSSFSRFHPITWAGIVQKQAGRINYTREYRKHAVSEVDYSKKFVYFPLHLQPELTTSVLGGEYSDQLLAMERLAAILPEDWYIYAKENPKQGFQQRNTLFFKRLSRIRNCVYVADTVSTYDLMSNCQFVASITGTACWEAISGGKPALVFGYAWFRKLPGVSEYREGIQLQDIIDQSFTHEELEQAFNELISKAVPGVVDGHYRQIVDGFDIEKNNQLLTNFLRHALSLPNDQASLNQIQ